MRRKKKHKLECAWLRNDGSKCDCGAKLVEVKNKFDKEFAKKLIDLWKYYKSTKEAREELNIPKSLPVFNAVNFLYWLEEHKE